MPDRDVVEAQEITIVALLREGQPKDTKVQFKLKYGDKEEEKEGQLTGDKQLSTDKAATIKLKAPEVPADKDNLEMTYSVVHEKRELSLAEKIVVWPKEGKLTAVDAADGKTKLKGFAYKVVQKQKNPTPPALRANDDGQGTFPLKPGEAFEVEAVAPFVIKKIDKTKPRDLKITAERKYTAIFDAPAIPDSKVIKQYVNQAHADDGQKGMGSRVLLRAMAKEDKDAKGELIAGPGVFAYVRATFSGHGGKPSKRKETDADKNPHLVAGKELSDIKEDTSDPNKKGVYLAKLELKKGGKGEFEVELGKAGGDTCVIEVGSTDKFADGCKVKFENRRKLYYAIYASDYAKPLLKEVTLEGAKNYDFPDETVSEMKTQITDIYLDLELVEGKAFPITDTHRAKKQIIPGSFRDRPAPLLFQVSDKQSQDTLRLFTAPAGKTPLMRFLLVDMNMYFDNKAAAGAAWEVGESKEFAVPLPDGYWLPITARNDTSDGLKNITWTADVTANPQPLTVEWAANIPGDNNGTDKRRVLKLREVSTNTSCTISWDKPTIGHIPQNVTDAQKQTIKTMLQQLITFHFRRATKNKLQLQITSLADQNNDRQGGRIQNVKDAVAAIITELALQDFDPHPGLEDDGSPRTGGLTMVCVDMSKSKRNAPWFKLPDALSADPGKFVGPLSASKCPISIAFDYDVHGSGVGCAYGGDGCDQSEVDLRGSMLVVFHSGSKLVTGNTAIHEAGHLFALTPYDAPADTVAPGIAQTKKFDETEVPEFQHNGTKGHHYAAHGGSGPHCAYGLSDAGKGQPTFQDGKCTMFGSGPSADAGRVIAPRLCPQCSMLLRARDMSTI
jgi:hypothetical protein